MKIYNSTMTIKQAMKELLAVLPVQGKEKVGAIALKDQWAQIVGEFAASRTTLLRIQGNTLFLRFNSTCLKQTLLYKKAELLEEVQGFNADIKRIFWY